MRFIIHKADIRVSAPEIKARKNTKNMLKFNNKLKNRLPIHNTPQRLYPPSGRPLVSPSVAMTPSLAHVSNRCLSTRRQRWRGAFGNLFAHLNPFLDNEAACLNTVCLSLPHIQTLLHKLTFLSRQGENK